MITRRSLFGFIATIALAPQLCFRVKPEPLTVDYWFEMKCAARYTDPAYEAFMAALLKDNPLFIRFGV